MRTSTEISDKNEIYIYIKISKFLLSVITIIIINIRATHLFSPHLNYNKNVKDVKVCLCAIGKKENLYAQEYVQHYKNLGYNHVFLYDNNVFGDEKFDNVLQNEVKVAL